MQEKLDRIKKLLNDVYSQEDLIQEMKEQNPKEAKELLSDLQDLREVIAGENNNPVYKQLFDEYTNFLKKIFKQSGEKENGTES